MLPRTHHRRRASQGKVAAWGLWALKWMMVVMMIVDQVGAPLHRHHHDSGVDAAYAAAASANHHDDFVDETHADGSAHHDAFAHSTLAVRQASTAQLSVAPTAADDDGQVTWLIVTSVLALLALASLKEESLIRPFVRWRAPHISIYRSLPPAGRAPPLHA